MTTFEEQIKLLVELQELDTHIFKMKSDLEAIPRAIKKKDDELKEKSVNLKKLEDESKALLMKRKEKEGEIESKEGVIKKYQSQLNLVKTNKEYTALQDEVGRNKADISVIEEDIIKIFDAADAKNREIAIEKVSLKVEESKAQGEKSAMETEAAGVKKELESVMAKRSELTPKIEPKILSKYERLLNNRDGLAIVPVTGDSCQGCFRALPPQVINEIRMKDAVVVCDSCARILYIEE